MPVQPLPQRLRDLMNPAPFTERDGVEAPADFGAAAAEWTAAHTGHAVAVLPWLTHIKVTGRHRARFIHNMTTCPVKTLAPGDTTSGMIVDGGGKLVATIRVDVGEDHLRIEMDRVQVERALAQLRRYIVADDVHFTPDDGALVFHGLGNVANAESSEGVTRRPEITRIGRPGTDFIVPRDEAASFWSLLTAIEGAQPVGLNAWEAARVSAGIPRDGVDMTDANIPLESEHLATLVDWDKGCYIGQEVLAMMHYRGRPSKHLRALRFPEGAPLPAVGDRVMDGAKAVGVIGTALTHPALGGSVAMAVIRRKRAESGTSLQVGEGEATVAEFPLMA